MILLHLNQIVYYIQDYILKSRKHLGLFLRKCQYFQYIQIKSLELYAFECFITHSPQCLAVPALVNPCQPYS